MKNSMQIQLEAMIAETLAAKQKRHEEMFKPKEEPSRSCPHQREWHPAKRRGCTECVGKICRKLLELGLDDEHLPLPSHLRPLCGARTRNSSRCSKMVVPGKKRCRYHGGLSTGPKTEVGKQRIREGQLDRRE